MNEFLQKPGATLGTAFFCKTIFKNEKVIKLSVWDTSGEEKFRAVTPMYYRGEFKMFFLERIILVEGRF